MSKRRRTNAPGHDSLVAENEYVKELLAVLKEHQSPVGRELQETVSHVSELEQQLADAIGELKAMRQDLEAMQNHPLKTALQKSIISLQASVIEMKEQLAQLKEQVIEGCKNALADFKERGAAALDGAACFFRIRPGLEAMRDSIDKGLQIDEKAIAKIEAFSTEYHKAGMHLKNMGRALQGKEVIQEAKPLGGLAKTIQAPYKAERACLRSMRSGVDKAIGSLSRLEQTAEKKPSILKTMQEHKETTHPKKAKAAPEAVHDSR